MRTTQKSTMILLLLLVTASCDRGPRSGPRAAAESPREVLYVIESPTDPVTVGEEQAVALKVKPRSGWKINREFHWSVDFHADGGAAVTPSKIAGDDIELSDAEAVIPVTVNPTTAGVVELPATADLSICNESKCELYQGVDVTFRVPASP